MNRPSDIYCGLSLNLDHDLISTALPLLEAGAVECIEWSFDSLFWKKEIPHWFTDLLKVFASEGRLLGHGVYFSILQGKWSSEQQQWLEELKTSLQVLPMAHVTEHFGFMTGPDFHKGAPMSPPFTEEVLKIGQDRLLRLSEATQVPVGLENLAFAFSREDVIHQMNFLRQLIEPVNGFLILDLHNLYCQSHNFKIRANELIQLYPLDLVREIHISGGSWAESPVSNDLIRRDTHDQAVPMEVFELLSNALPYCSNLKYVILEQLGHALKTTQSQAQFRSDFIRMKQIVASADITNERENDFQPTSKIQAASLPFESKKLYNEQQLLSRIFEDNTDLQDLKNELQAAGYFDNAWRADLWQDDMLHTAMSITKKWKGGFRLPSEN